MIDIFNNSAFHQARKALLLAVGGSMTLLLGGCALNSATSATATTTPIAGVSFQGKFMGGQQPVAGVAIQLYTAGTSTYGSAATPLLPPGTVTTNAGGNFTLPSYMCPTASSLIYLVGTGGTPIGGSQNLNLALMAGLGPCGSLSTSTFINVDELTTVATVWASGRFMTGIANIGAPTANLAGLTAAFAAINKVVNISTGQAPGPALPTGATLPIPEINALGNILQNCVNSAGGSASDTMDGLTSGTPCGKLFFLSKTGSSTPTDTITAAMNIAQNPSVNTVKLNDLQASSPAFSPSLNVNAPPTDWTIAINYVGGGLSTPQTVANDSSGNVWVTNKGNSSVTELDNTGAAVSSAAGFTAGSLNVPWGIAIDESGFVWVSNSGNNTLSRLASTGTTGSFFSGNGLSTPKGVAIDGAGNVWVANNGSNAISQFNSTGSAVGTYLAGGINKPASIAVDPK